MLRIVLAVFAALCSTASCLQAADAHPSEAPASSKKEVTFDNDIVPVLTKAGCNTGACHGAAIGRGGFKLSLYGGNPKADYLAIRRELRGRRINLVAPEQSLLLLKPMEEIAHGGGYRLEHETAGAELLQRWIEQGALFGSERRLKSIQVSPTSAVLPGINESVQLTATATFSDGTQRDVTEWTVFKADDPAAVEVDPELATASVQRPGRHVVVARYLSQVVAIELLVPLTNRPASDSATPTDDTRSSPIASGRHIVDQLVDQKLATLRLPASPATSGKALVRRLYLDLTGRLPTWEQVVAFEQDRRPDAVERLVDRLLASQEFNQYWTLQLAELFRLHTQPQDREGAKVYHRWLHEQIASDASYADTARQMIMALGDSHENGAANFYRTVAGPREQAEFLSELFMGSRLRCANCHNHPLDRWTQDDYHGLAAVFARIASGRVVALKESGSVNHPRTGEPAIPRIPGDQFLEAEVDGRDAIAQWLTQANNPYFSKAIVNRLWKAMMGRGLVEPVDDMRATNPASHPALLSALADDFVENGFRLKHTLKLIATSQAYARSSQALTDNREDQTFYSRSIVRPLSAQVLADAVSDVLNVPEKYGDEKLGTRAIELFDPKTPSLTLDVLGRCSREDTCESSPAVAEGLTTQLHLLNGPLLNVRISHSDGRLAQLVQDEQSTETIIIEFYRTALSRDPSRQELDFWETQLDRDDRESRQQALEDFVWGILCCEEFTSHR